MLQTQALEQSLSDQRLARPKDSFFAHLCEKQGLEMTSNHTFSLKIFIQSVRCTFKHVHQRVNKVHSSSTRALVMDGEKDCGLFDGFLPLISVG